MGDVSLVVLHYSIAWLIVSIAHCSEPLKRPLISRSWGACFLYMPNRPKSPCTYPGCGRLVDRPGRCAEHAKPAWASNAGKSAAKRGYGYAWRKLREQAMRRDGGLCQPCLATGRVTPATECDHIVPKAQGGLDTLGNVQAICRQCHKAKTGLE